MIRLVEPKELPMFAQMGAEFFGTLGLPGEFKVDVFTAYWTNLITTGAGFILGRFLNDAPVEAIGAVLYPDMQTGDLTSCTTFWYVRPNNSLAVGLLAEEVKGVWKDMGVKHCFFSILCNDRMDKVSGFLMRSGYRLAEMQFRKDT